MLELRRLTRALDEIAEALADQGSQEFGQRWSLRRSSGEFHLSGEDFDVDDEDEDEDEEDLVPIHPIPSYVWYQDMVDFADGVSDATGARRLTRALDGRGAFRRFKNELREEYPDWVRPWQAFRETRARNRAGGWLRDEELISYEAAERYLNEHPDPPIP